MEQCEIVCGLLFPPDQNAAETIHPRVGALDHLTAKLFESVLRMSKRVRQNHAKPVHCTALACSPVPDCRSHRTRRLPAEKAVEPQIAPAVSAMTVCRALKKRPAASPWQMLEDSTGWQRRPRFVGTWGADAFQRLVPVSRDFASRAVVGLFKEAAVCLGAAAWVSWVSKRICDRKNRRIQAG